MATICVASTRRALHRLCTPIGFSAVSRNSTRRRFDTALITKRRNTVNTRWKPQGTRHRGSARSPNPGAVLRSTPHRIAFPDAEGVVERLEVHQRPDGADRPGRMGIDDDPLTKLVLADVRAPHLRPREEEALLGREPVDELPLLAGERALQGLEGEARAAEVGDVLAEGQLAVHFHPGERL